MITATALVLLMIPGVGFFYSGLARRKSALSLIWLSVMATGVISFQWFFWGYSLAFSHDAGKYIGSLANFGFRNVLAAPSVGNPKIPDLLFAVCYLVLSVFYPSKPQQIGLPRHVRCDHCCTRGWRRRRTRTDGTLYRFHVRLEYRHLRSHRVLDLESIWMGLQHGWA